MKYTCCWLNCATLPNRTIVQYPIDSKSWKNDLEILIDDIIGHLIYIAVRR